MTGAHHVANGGARSWHLSRAAPATQLLNELVDLTEPGRPERLTLGEQSPRRVDRQPPAERGIAAAEQRSLVARLAEPEIAVGEKLRGRIGVLTLHDVEVFRPEARLLPRKCRRAFGRARAIVRAEGSSRHEPVVGPP